VVSGFRFTVRYTFVFPLNSSHFHYLPSAPSLPLYPSSRSISPHLISLPPPLSASPHRALLPPGVERGHIGPTKSVVLARHDLAHLVLCLGHSVDTISSAQFMLRAAISIVCNIIATTTYTFFNYNVAKTMYTFLTTIPLFL
jgi:hypothetical protein